MTNPITHGESTSYGEIPLSKPSKWSLVTSRRHIAPQTASTLSSNWSSYYNADGKTTVQCKRIVRREEPGSTPFQKPTMEESRSGKRTFTQLSPVEDRRTGMKMVQRDTTQHEYHRPERRHVRPTWETYKKESAEELVNGMGNYSCGREVSRSRSTPSKGSASHRPGRHLVTGENGEKVSAARASEVSLSDEMARRKQVQDKRNGIPEQFAKGEKPYRVVEHSEQFHDGSHTKPRQISTDVAPLEPKFTMNDRVAHTRLMEPQKARERDVQRREEVAMVKALDSWEPKKKGVLDEQ